MTDTENHESLDYAYDPDHPPLNVRIVEDSTSGSNEPSLRPSRHTPRQFVIPASGSMQGLPRNPLRFKAQLWADKNNVGIVFVTDNTMQPAHSFGIGPTQQLTMESTGGFQLTGTPNDILYVFEESFDK